MPTQSCSKPNSGDKEQQFSDACKWVMRNLSIKEYIDGTEGYSMWSAQTQKKCCILRI